MSFSRKRGVRGGAIEPVALEAAADCRWLHTGRDAMGEMLTAIRQAKKSVRLEMYIFQPCEIGEQFREAMIAAAQRGAKVSLLADAVGSYNLKDEFCHALVQAGGEFRRFNIPGWWRFGLRDHRKLLICDEEIAFIGGLNVGPEYAGDGVTEGWRDLGLRLNGKMAGHLAEAYDSMFHLAGFKRPRFRWLRHAIRQRRIEAASVTALLGAPGWRRNPLVKSMVEDFRQAQSIRIMCAYFLPTKKVFRALIEAARRGARVQIILAGPTDVGLMKMATKRYYRRMLYAGVEIYEYQPQVLHAKMMVLDDRIVYVGSANLDVRSLHLNYELLLRFENKQLAKEAGEIFERDLPRSHQIKLSEWLRTRTWWKRLRDRIAHFLLGRLDPYLASWSWRR